MSLQGKDCRIVTGKYAGLMGSVIEHREETEMVKVKIEGLHQGEEINVEPWMKEIQVEGV